MCVKEKYKKIQKISIKMSILYEKIIELFDFLSLILCSNRSKKCTCTPQLIKDQASNVNVLQILSYIVSHLLSMYLSAIKSCIT